MNIRNILNAMPVYGLIRYRINGYKEDIEKGVGDIIMASKAASHGILALAVVSALLVYGIYVDYTGEFNLLKLPQAIEEKRQHSKIEEIVGESIINPLLINK